MTTAVPTPEVEKDTLDYTGGEFNDNKAPLVVQAAQKGKGSVPVGPGKVCGIPRLPPLHTNHFVLSR
jgi:hypothetical protein